MPYHDSRYSRQQHCRAEVLKEDEEHRSWDMGFLLPNA
jgi:hypothetical protein